MPSGPYERFYPGEDRGLLDPTWGGGAYRLNAPSDSHKGSALMLGLLGGGAAGYGAKLGYQGIVRGGQALDRVLPALKTLVKRAAPVWGEGLLDYGVGKQTEKEVEKVIEKVKERREPIPRQRTGRVSQLELPHLSGGSWYSRAEDAVVNADQEKGDAGYWINRIGEAGGRKELGMTGGDVVFDTLKENKGSMSKSEVLGLLQPYTIKLKETYHTFAPSYLTKNGKILGKSYDKKHPYFRTPIFSSRESLNLDVTGSSNPIEILLRLPDRNIQTDSVAELVESWGPSRRSGNFQDHDWPNDLNVLVHIRANDGFLFDKKALIIQEIQSNWHQKGQAEGYRQPLMMTPDDMELKRVSVEEAFHYGQRRDVRSNSLLYRTGRASEDISPWWEMVDFQDWQERRNLPEGTPVTLYRMKGSDKWELAPESDITLDELWNREFDYYSGGETRPNDAFYDAFEASSNNRVPDAPYKKTWHELGFKRALMEALRDPDKEYLAWAAGNVQAKRAFGSGWESAFPERSKFHLNLYDKKMVKFAKKFLGVEPQRHKPGEWTVYDKRTENPVRYFDSADEAERYVNSRRQIEDAGSPNAFLDYDKTKGDLWYIKITDDMRDKFIKALEEKAIGGPWDEMPAEVQMPLAQKEGGGLLGRYA